jgi:membrane associated rhomboid family serine protease
MNETGSNLVADVLHACAAVAPQPWQHEGFLRSRSEGEDAVEYCLDELCLANVLKPARGNNGTILGLILTPRGEELARDPQALERFCEAEGLHLSGDETPQRIVIRQTLLSRPRPRVNRVLFWANVGVFLIGYVVAMNQKPPAGKAFLLPQVGGLNDPGVRLALHRTGMVHRQDVLDGQWWRLLTHGFVHYTLLHLAMNLFVLRFLGRDSEWLWGPWRYLVLYVMGVIGGGCAALTEGDAAIGASGALCGLVAAEAVWMLVNRRFLPRDLVRSQSIRLFISGLLIAALSVLQGVSGVGHLGGAVAGAVAALLLHWQRFGQPLTSRLAVLGLIALPVACVVGLRQVSMRDPHWAEAREKRQKKTLEGLREDLAELYEETRRFQPNSVNPLLEARAERRDAAEVQKVTEELSALIARHEQAAERLADLPAFEDARLEEFRSTGQRYFSLRARFMKRMVACLRAKVDWKGGDDQEDEVAEAQKRWVSAYRALR